MGGDAVSPISLAKFMMKLLYIITLPGHAPSQPGPVVAGFASFTAKPVPQVHRGTAL